MKSLSFVDLRDAVTGRAAAFRTYIRLQPAGGSGTKVFPPTYSGGVYAGETRRIHGKDAPCVLLDSVQSQANRLEEALRAAWEDGRLKLPIILTDFSKEFPEIGRITTLDAPHRIADAIFRDSRTEDNREFRDAFARAFEANIRNATALFELCPTALVFGTWDSTGSRGGLGNKFARALVSEIVGVNAVSGVRTSSRLDPLGIEKCEVYQASDGSWTVNAEDAIQDGNGKPELYGRNRDTRGKPSAINHGNVTPDIVRAEKSTDPIGGGVTIDYALQTSVVSLPALRRLRFPSADAKKVRERDEAAQTALAALALAAITEQHRQGYFLRSRCDLVPETDGLVVERVTSAAVSDDDKFTLDPDGAIQLLDEALKAAEKNGLKWDAEPIRLVPKPALMDLVRKSREVGTSVNGEDV